MPWYRKSFLILVTSTMKLSTAWLKYSVHNVYGAFMLVNFHSILQFQLCSLWWQWILELYLISVVRMMTPALFLKQQL